jgi:erythromycin esterase-like protein
VAAASDWDEPMQVMRVRPSHRDSIERACHDAGLPCALLDLRGGDAGADEGLRAALLPSMLERFIGVVYRPETELQSHYAEASLPRQFDAYVWFDDTSAVVPLRPGPSGRGVPDTWPFGV